MKEDIEQVASEPESFIVQNVTLGPHYVSDIRLQFDPLAVIDLTWEDAKVIRASKDLRNSMRMGLLKKITPEQWDLILEKQSIREKKELLNQQGRNNLKTIEVDGKELQVESIETDKAYKSDNTVSTAGYANDSLSYAMAFDIAQTTAELQGDDLTAEQFADMVKTDPTVVQRYMSMHKNMEATASVSGDTRKGKAFVATSPSDYNNTTTVAAMEMTNFRKDGYIAGGEFNYLDTPDDDGIADVIDLEAADDLGSDKGSVRRL
jgi:hypothetical protein